MGRGHPIIFDYKYLVVPINKEYTHWYLAVVDLDLDADNTNQVWILDSLHNGKSGDHPEYNSIKECLARYIRLVTWLLCHTSCMG